MCLFQKKKLWDGQTIQPNMCVWKFQKKDRSEPPLSLELFGIHLGLLTIYTFFLIVNTQIYVSVFIHHLVFSSDSQLYT